MGCSMSPDSELPKRPEGRAVLHVEGDLDLASAEMMELFLQEAQDSPGLLVDVRGVDCADSSGIRVLVESARRMEDQGFDLRVAGAGPRVARAFSVLGLDRMLDVNPDQKPPAPAPAPTRGEGTGPSRRRRPPGRRPPTTP